MLGAAGADDDDRRADALAARRLDQLPAVRAGQHQVEHADVRPLVAQPREPGLAVRDAERVEARDREVPRHPLGDHVVVLDDQDLRHAVESCSAERLSEGCRSGNGLVKSLLYNRSDGGRRRTRPGAVEESRETVVVLDADGVVLAASRRARESLEGLVEGGAASAGAPRTARTPLVVPYEVARPRRAARLPRPGRRPGRLRGAALGLHRRGLARAADAARAPARAARDSRCSPARTSADSSTRRAARSSRSAS